MPDLATIAHQEVISSLERDIVRILAYFDVFNYPLRVGQIISHLSESTISEAAVVSELRSLVHRSVITENGAYYSLSSDPAQSVQLRERHERRAKIMIKRARHVAHLIKLVPFVRGIFLTGSLSKGVVPNNGDIDFMIITAPNRLWISRFFLTIIKKTLFANSKKHFCINLLLSERNLGFKERSYYNAIEIATVIPLWNSRLFKRFHEENRWVRAFFPNWRTTSDQSLLLPERSARVQQFLESIFSAAPLSALDAYFLRRARRHWIKKYSHLDRERFDRLVQCRIDISTVWAEDLKTSIIQSFEQRFERCAIRLSS